MSQSTAVREASTAVYKTRSDCRMCGSTELEKVWSFGETPLANNYLTPKQAAALAEPTKTAGASEPRAPLDVFYCADCHLVQLRDVVSPQALFDHYLYVSSTSPSFVKHFADYAVQLIERFNLTPDSLVVDVGSNDGVLLKPLQEAGVRILGVDPAKNIAEQATGDGIETRADYFTPDVAKNIASQHGLADVISANNVFAHTDGVDSFVEAVKLLLQRDGVFVFEVQYLGDLIAKNLFDIVYHEHVNYYSMHPLVTFFTKHDMAVFDVERLPVHGGSVRVFVQHVGGPHERSTRLAELMLSEKKQALTTAIPYRQFAQRIARNKDMLREMISSIKAEGKRIVGFGAPAKATTLMYAFGLTGDDIDFIVDDAPLKQGMLMPGTHIPIYVPDALYGEEPAVAPPGAGTMADRPDYCLILAWNFAEPIMKNHQRFVDQGGRFILPIPEPTIV